MEIKLTSNINEFIKSIDEKYKKKIPTIIKSSLNKTIYAVEKDLKGVMPQVFDKPTKYLIDNAFELSEKATEINPAVAIRLKPGLGERILSPHILGTEREKKPLETKMQSKGLLPKPAQTISSKSLRDTFGNLPYSQYKNLSFYTEKLRGKLFSSSPVTKRTEHIGIPGLYERTNKGNNIKPVILFTQGKIKYKKRFDFKKIVSELVGKHFANKFAEAFKNEINK